MNLYRFFQINLCQPRVYFSATSEISKSENNLFKSELRAESLAFTYTP